MLPVTFIIHEIVDPGGPGKCECKKIKKTQMVIGSPYLRLNTQAKQTSVFLVPDTVVIYKQA